MAIAYCGSCKRFDNASTCSQCGGPMSFDEHFPYGVTESNGKSLEAIDAERTGRAKAKHILSPFEERAIIEDCLNRFDWMFHDLEKANPGQGVLSRANALKSLLQACANKKTQRNLG